MKVKDKSQFAGFDKHEYNPVVRPQTQKLLIGVLQKHHPKKILEIGTYLGYSAYVMLCTCQDATLTTLEKDEQNFQFAKQNLEEFSSRVNLQCCDAIDFLSSAQNGTEKFDFIFLDGPKGQYVKYLPMLKKILAKGGVLFADDVMFYGKVESGEKIEHKHRSIVNNLRKFLADITSDNDFETQIFEIEDGVSISVKK